CMVKINPKSVQINDMKTGMMNKEIYDARKAKKSTPEHKALLKNKTKRFPNPLEAGKWHTLGVLIMGDTMSVTINEKEVGSFSSEGIAHPTKRLLRVAVPKKAIIDDLKIYALPKS
ncbi:hypothetical protein OAF84_05430, partial [Akkermansiaceae bacterium]|nr:hypothetical protein [Akkermansiaceae bacterium]